MAGMHTTSINISQPEPLVKKGNLGENWNKWKQNFKIYLIASGIQETDKSACALFLHTIGQDGRDICNDILELSDISDTSLQELYQKFDKHCNPKSSLAFTRYEFFSYKQGKETFDTFLLNLKKKSKNCEFGDLNDSLMMTQIIAGISNKKLQERLFLISDLDLEKTIQECRSTELAESHVQHLPGVAPEKKSQKVPSDAAKDRAAPKEKSKPNKNKGENKGRKDQSSEKKSETSENQNKFKCKFCGGIHGNTACPAFGTVCKLCEKPNHFPNVCRNRKFNCKQCGSMHVYGSCPAFGTVCKLCEKPNHFANVCKN